MILILEWQHEALFLYSLTSFFESDHYKPTELEEDWGREMARKLAKFDAFAVFNYELFNDPEEASKKVAKNFNEIFKKLGVDHLITASPDWDDENGIIGFDKVERNAYNK